jgi:transposase
MRQETFTLSQKELQRVSVINACIKGEMACARAAGLLGLSVRQIKRLKKRMREDGEAALAHANRGRPSHRRLPKDMATRIDGLDRICCFVHERIVSNDNVVQWEGRRFQIPQQARRFSFAGAKVLSCLGTSKQPGQTFKRKPISNRKRPLSGSNFPLRSP